MKKNVISGIIKGIGAAYCIIGVVFSIMSKAELTKVIKAFNLNALSDLPFTSSLAVLFSFVLVGVLLIGFGEVIQLLQDIKDKQ